MNPLATMNRWPWYGRWPLKVSLFGLTILVVCFPYPRMLARNLARWGDPDRLIEPEHPRLGAWIAELRAGLPAGTNHDETLHAVQRFVYEKVPYEWDWNTWGVADYLPTVAEVLDQGREDCDGRAVVAASLLRNLGYDAHLVNDLTHVWVRTEVGDTLSPGTAPIITRTDEGRQFRLPSLAESARAAGVGIAVFPASREVVIVFVFWLLLIRPGTGWPWAVGGAALLIASLVLHRLGGSSLQHDTLPITTTLGTVCLIAAVAMLIVAGNLATHRARSTAHPRASAAGPASPSV